MHGHRPPLCIGEIDHQIWHERERLTVQGGLDQAGIDIDDAIGEAFVVARRAIVPFVGMQNMALAGQAVSGFAAIMKGLYAGKRDADGVAVVTVRRKGPTAELRFQALDALASATDGDGGRIIAQSFKTARVPTLAVAP